MNKKSLFFSVVIFQSLLKICAEHEEDWNLIIHAGLIENIILGYCSTNINNIHTKLCERFSIFGELLVKTARFTYWGVYQ